MGKAKFIHGSLDEKNLELNYETYDVVLICGALQYTENVDFAISQIFNLLKKWYIRNLSSKYVCNP